MKIMIFHENHENHENHEKPLSAEQIISPHPSAAEQDLTPQKVSSCSREKEKNFFFFFFFRKYFFLSWKILDFSKIWVKNGNPVFFGIFDPKSIIFFLHFYSFLLLVCAAQGYTKLKKVENHPK